MATAMVGSDLPVDRSMAQTPAAHPIDTAAKPSDIFTTPLAEDLFVKHRKCLLLGW